MTVDESPAGTDASPAGTGPTPSTTSDVGRIVMIATSWWRWDFAGDVGKIQRILNQVLDDDGTGPSWILEPRRPQACLAPQKSGLEPEFASQAMAELYRERGHDATWIGCADGPDRIVADVVQVLTAIGQEHQDTVVSTDTTIGRLRALDIRVYLSQQRARSTFGISDAVPWHGLCLDVTFSRAEIDNIDRLLCLISASVWTDPPFSEAHAPPVFDRSGPPGPVDLDSTIAFFQGQVRRKIENYLDDEVGQAVRRTIRGRPYLAPMFWLVTPRDPAVEGARAHDPACGPGEQPGDAAANGRAGVGQATITVNGTVGRRDHVPFLDRIATTLLHTENPRSTTVTSSRVSGGLHVLRRLIPVAEHLDVPVYAMVPCYPRTRRGTPADQLLAIYGRREDDVAAVVLAVSELEAQAAALFYDVDTDLTIWENYVRLYEVAAERASTLWDALAMHLPLPQRSTLGAAHRAIELIHLTLTQGVAGLTFAHNKVESVAAKLDRQAGNLADRCENLLAESRTDQASSLRSALSEEGYVGVLARRATQVAADVERTRANFQGLFSAIGGVFDERRARETDRLAESSLALSFALALFGGVTMIDVLVNIKGQDRAPMPNAWIAAVLLIGALLLGTAGWVLVRVRRHGRLGTVAFHRIYADLRAYLRRVSTDEIDWLARRLTNEATKPDALPRMQEVVRSYLDRPDLKLAAPGCARCAGDAEPIDHAWAAVDEELSTQLAATWRTVHEHRRQRRRPHAGADVDALTTNVERWSLRAMLITERPPELFRFPLPRLVALYCALSARPDCILSRSPERSLNAISEVDLRFNLQNRGFEPEKVGPIYRWLCLQGARDLSVSALADQVETLGLRPVMCDAHRARTVARSPTARWSC